MAGNDTLNGGDGNDNIQGGVGSDIIEGGFGDDLMHGGDGTTDVASYANATSGVTVNLAITGAQNTVYAGTDTLLGFERITGSAYTDTLTGDAGANQLVGGNGNDILDGGAGDDTLNGGGNTDTATYANATAAVAVDLSNASAQNTVGAGTDTL